ncbi:MAG: SpoIID/LytB domain-containing protein [Mobilicoccus sp.]|nr:SpoIID/LytB domain-containing protein [Mobilicoccus sp.]
MTRAAPSLVRLAAVPLMGLALIAADAVTAHASEPPVPVPSDGKIVLDGRGFGHGRGMSQWGAYGAADAGLGWQQIVGFYYPGATQARQANTEMRVWISRDNDGATQVPPQSNLRATVGRTVYRLPAGANYTSWRATQSGSVVVLQYRDARGTWRNHATQRSNHVVFTAGDTVRVTMPGGRHEDFPGAVIAQSQNGRVITIVRTTMERYLQGVVPHEMPTSWHPQALAAQSVAARTYASSYRDRQRARRVVWDICDTVTCQVYRPASSVAANGSGRVVHDNARANQAISATSGTVLRTPNGNYVHAEFSASNGGYTVNGGAFSQVAKADPYDARMRNPNTSWSREVTASSLASRYGLGTLRSIQVLGRDGNGADGGRVSRLRLNGTTKSVDITGMQARQVMGLRSDWFTIRGSGATRPGGGTTTTTAPTPAPAPTGAAASPGVGGVGPSTTWIAEWTGDRIHDRLSIVDGRLLIERGLGGGRYAAPAPVPGAPEGLRTIVGVGDVDYDRRADVVVVNNQNRLVVLRGNGQARVQQVITLGGGWGAFRTLHLADVTGDRRVDIVGTYPDGRRMLYVGTAQGTFRGMGAYTR